MISRLWISARRFEASPIHEEYVRPSIIVVVEEGHATAGGFDDVPLIARAAEDSPGIQAGIASDVFETDPESAFRSLGMSDCDTRQKHQYRKGCSNRSSNHGMEADL